VRTYRGTAIWAMHGLSSSRTVAEATYGKLSLVSNAASVNSKDNRLGPLTFYNMNDMLGLWRERAATK